MVRHTAAVIGRAQSAAFLFFILLFAFASCTKNPVVLKTKSGSFTRGNIVRKAEYYCAYYGINPALVKNDESIWGKLLSDIVREYAWADIAEEKAGEAGLLPLSADEEKAAASEYEKALRDIDGFVIQEQAAAGGAYDADKVPALRAACLKDMGFTEEGFRLLARKKIITQKLISDMAETAGIASGEEALILYETMMRQWYEEAQKSGGVKLNEKALK